MNLSLAIGIMMLLVKGYAWMVTRSSAVLSDAVESVVHVLAVGFAVWSLNVSLRPADDDHPYGHAKIGFFSAGFEGGMISLAGLFILFDAIRSLAMGGQVQNLESGLLLVFGVLVVNGLLGWYLVRLGRSSGSLILEANGRHVLTDAWTSVGVLIALAVTRWTGWLWVDPVVAMGIGGQILVSGVGLMRKASQGLMDHADPEVSAMLTRLLDTHTQRMGISYHALRHRNTGAGQWVDMHLLFDDGTPVKEAHRMATEIEDAVRDSLGVGTGVTTHLEPLFDHDRIHGIQQGDNLDANP